ncbi:uncharacterized protein A1O9_12949, partial [Exophiala aquamarina CBS 119918]
MFGGNFSPGQSLMVATPMATSTSCACVGVLGNRQNVYVRAFCPDCSYFDDRRCHCWSGWSRSKSRHWRRIIQIDWRRSMNWRVHIRIMDKSRRRCQCYSRWSRSESRHWRRIIHLDCIAASIGECVSSQWTEQGDGVATERGARDQGADASGGSSGSTGVAAGTGYSISSQWTDHGGGVTPERGAKDQGTDTGGRSSGSTGITV